MTTNNQKQKTVQNYILQSIKYVNIDQSQIWFAKHKILKKTYMLKRVQFLKNNTLKIANFDNNDEINAFRLKKTANQIELLKCLKLSDSPKCQKMIKTSNNIYVVYDEFPGDSLHYHMKTHHFSLEQKLQIMRKISNSLVTFHQLFIYFLLMSPDNIFISENQNIFFSEWSSAVYKNNTAAVFPIITLRKSSFIASQVLQESRCSSASDIYSLGKIFSFIADKNNKSSKSESELLQLTSLIESMTDKDDLKRPSLQKIISRLDKIIKAIPKTIEMEPSKEIYSSKLQHKPTQATLNTYESQISQEKKQGLKRLKSSQYVKDSIFPESKQVKTNKLKTAFSFDNILIGISRAISRPSVSRIKRTNDGFVRKTNKGRNLSFFIIGLSDFALTKFYGEQLGYLLLKQSYMMLNSCYQQWSSQNFQDKNGTNLTEILKEEIVQLNLTLNMLKQYLYPQEYCQQFKNQLRNDLAINQRFYNEKIVAFCHSSVEELNVLIKENKIKSINGLVDNLFTIYMILKKLEQGSFQKYWDKIYCSQFAYLKSQKYFDQQKRLGYRYLKSKISEILNLK